MILRSIAVEGWRCFVEKTVVGPFSDGLNIIHAPNGTGKSTLFTALIRGLFDRHNLSGQAAEGMRPWGRALTPSVTIEFFHQGEEYQLTKRFLDQASATLSKKVGDRYSPIASGRAADEQLRQIFSGVESSHGLTNPANWGLAQALWAPQGGLQLDGLPSDLVATIHASLDAQVSTTTWRPIEKRIQEEYYKYFTSTGRIKTGKQAPQIETLRQRRAQLLAERPKILEKRNDFETASRLIEDIRANRNLAKRQELELEEIIEKLNASCNEYVRFEAECEQARQREALARAKHAHLKERLERFVRLNRESQDTLQAIASLENELLATQDEVQKSQTHLSLTQSKLEDARKQRAEVSEKRKEAEKARVHLVAVGEYAELCKRIAEIEALEAKSGELAALQNDLVAPTDEKIAEIQKALQQQDRAQGRLEAALITLELIPSASGSLEVISGETLGAYDLAKGAPIQLKGAPDVVVEVKGFGRIRAHGPSEGIAELRDNLRKAEETLKTLITPYGTDDLLSLQKMRERGKDLENQQARLDAKLDGLYREASGEDLSLRRSALRHEIEGILADFPDWEKAPPDLNALLQQTEREDKEAEENILEAEKARELAQSILQAATTKLDRTKSELQSQQQKLAFVTEQCQEFRQEKASEAVLREELGRIALEWDASQALQRQTEGALAAFPTDPRVELETNRLQLKQLGQNTLEMVSREKEQEGKLSSLSADAPHTALAQLDEEIGVLDEEIAREEINLQAIQLLNNTVESIRQDTLGVISQPIEALSSRILHRIAGQGIGKIVLSESLNPEKIAPTVLENQVQVSELSGGEVEQVHLSVRLALAEYLSKGERHLMVLDDALTVTDGGRLTRIINILQEMSQTLQIVILTCHPERYYGSRNATFFDLARVRDEQLKQ